MPNGHDEDFRPQDWDSDELKEGLYIWPVCVQKAQLKDPASDKPFIKLDVTVEEFPDGFVEKASNVGFNFDFRLYLSKKSKGWAMYFFKKFAYPEALLGDGKNPVIRTSEMIDLRGQLLVEVSINDMGFLKTDVKGFDAVAGEELFKRRDAILKARQEAAGHEEEAPARDLEEDVKTTSVGREPGSDDPFEGFPE